MELATFFWKFSSGWSIESFPPLDSEQTLVFVFGSVRLLENSQPLSILKQAYPNSEFMGCSTAGEIWGSTLLEQSLVVSVLRFQQTQLKTALCPILSESHVANKLNSAKTCYSAGRFIATQLVDRNLRAVLILADGLHTNGSELLRGLNSVFYHQTSLISDLDSFLIVGGLAADYHQFKRTWVLERGLPKTSYVAAVGFYGDAIQISCGSQGGWTIFGPERKVTRSERNILYELDHKPILQLYQEYLGTRATDLPTSGLFFPLALGALGTRKHIIRTIIGLDPTTESMRFTGDIPEGAVAQLMRGNYERLVDGALAAALITRNSSQRKMGEWEQNKLNISESFMLEPSLAIAISGSGRRLVLGERTEEELEATLDELPKGTQQIGFYSYGEFAPYGSTFLCELHNQTMTLITIRENSS